MLRLKGQDVLALGFMTFALFLGAGNVIFPPYVGMLAGEHFWAAVAGFLVTGVGLPLLTVVALARVGGGMDQLTTPIGRKAGVALAIMVYLAVGPLFATPRTAVVSFEVGIAPLTGASQWALFAYTTAYFIAVLLLVLNPGQLLNRLGRVLTPMLLAVLLLLGGAAVLLPAGEAAPAHASYVEGAFSQGFLQGYLTMDTLGALVYGIVITTAVRGQGIREPGQVTRYAIMAGVIAAVGLSLVYLSLFYLGAGSHDIAADAENGVQILTAYVNHTFGIWGTVLLALVMTLACLTTGVGLVVACGEFFSKLFGISYQRVVWIVVLFSLAVSNQGLTQLIQLSTPVLVGLYPLAIVLVCLSLAMRFWRQPSRIFVPALGVTLVFSVFDALQAADLGHWVPAVLKHLPLADQGMGWLLPVLVTLLVAIVADRGLDSSARSVKE